mmetsp:Transcript_33601/g.77517  ORF Transcript_33601/g.77517 Transcript_33601/m.77517 type:complete len:90 (-) Transcript_33601:69-338(-)
MYPVGSKTTTGGPSATTAFFPSLNICPVLNSNLKLMVIFFLPSEFRGNVPLIVDSIVVNCQNKVAPSFDLRYVSLKLHSRDIYSSMYCE